MYQTRSPRILGIDPGLANCGYAVVSRNKSGQFFLMDAGVIRTDCTQTQAARVLDIYKHISELLYVHTPNLIAVESVFFNKNVSSAMSTAGIGSICLLAAEQAGIKSLSLRPQDLKSVCGHPNASKQDVQRVVSRLIKTPISNSHAADAIAAAIAGHLHASELNKSLLCKVEKKRNS